MSGERLFQVRLLVKPSNETVPIINHDERHRAAQLLQPREPGERRAQAHLAVACLDHR